eukprot:7492897-Karenia_brevis.AAC.1
MERNRSRAGESQSSIGYPWLQRSTCASAGPRCTYTDQRSFYSYLQYLASAESDAVSSDISNAFGQAL